MDTISDTSNIFTYNSPIGKFIIKYQYDLNKWNLELNDEGYGYYNSPVAAADDVYCQCIGYYEWDNLDIDDVPTDIHEWQLEKRMREF